MVGLLDRHVDLALGAEVGGARFSTGAYGFWAAHVRALLVQAEKLGLHRLDMGDQAHVWSARAAGAHSWRVARALTWDELEAGAGRWLDTGQD